MKWIIATGFLILLAIGGYAAVTAGDNAHIIRELAPVPLEEMVDEAPISVTVPEPVSVEPPLPKPNESGSPVLIEIFQMGSPTSHTMAYADGSVVVNGDFGKEIKTKVLTPDELTRLKEFIDTQSYTLWQNNPQPVSDGFFVVDSYASFYVYDNAKRIQIEPELDVKNLLLIYD